MKTFKQYIKTKTKKKDKLPHVFVGLPRYLSEGSQDSLLKEEDDINSSDSKDDLARDLDKNSKPNLSDVESKHVHEYTGPSSSDINNQLRGEGPEKQEHTDSINHISNAIQRHRVHRNVDVYTGLASSPEPHRDPSTGELIFKNPAFTSTSIRPSVALMRAGRKDKNTNVNKLREHIENGDHEKAKELLKHHHIYFHHSLLAAKDAGWNGQRAHKHGEKFDLNNQSHIDTLKKNDMNRSGGHFHEASHVIQTTLPRGSHGLWIGRHLSSHDEGEVVLHPGAQFHVHETVVSEPDRDNPTPRVVHHATLIHDGVKPTGLKPPRRKGSLSRLLPRKKAA